LVDQPGQNANRPGGAASQIYQGLIARGFNPAQAAALVGNMQVESGFSPNAYNAGEGAVGLIQWENERRANLNNFAAAQGKPANDLGVQLDFIKHEMTGSEAGNSRAFLAATDVANANHALHQYIRYGSPTEGTRLANAQAVASGNFPAGGNASTGSAAAAPGAPAQTPQTAAPPNMTSMIGQALGSMAAPSMGSGSSNAALAQAAPPAPGPQMAFRAAADDAVQASNSTAGGLPGAGAPGQPGTGAPGMTGLLGLMQDPTAQSQVQLPTDVPMTGMSGLLYSGGAGLGIRRPAVTRLT
jgi:Phage tail lysozyme